MHSKYPFPLHAHASFSALQFQPVEASDQVRDASSGNTSHSAVSDRRQIRQALVNRDLEWNRQGNRTPPHQHPTRLDRASPRQGRLDQRSSPVPDRAASSGCLPQARNSNRTSHGWIMEQSRVMEHLDESRPAPPTKGAADSLSGAMQHALLSLSAPCLPARHNAGTIRRERLNSVASSTTSW